MGNSTEKEQNQINTSDAHRVQGSGEEQPKTTNISQGNCSYTIISSLKSSHDRLVLLNSIGNHSFSWSYLFLCYCWCVPASSEWKFSPWVVSAQNPSRWQQPNLNFTQFLLISDSAHIFILLHSNLTVNFLNNIRKSWFNEFVIILIRNYVNIITIVFFN